MSKGSYNLGDRVSPYAFLFGKSEKSEYPVSCFGEGEKLLYTFLFVAEEISGRISWIPTHDSTMLYLYICCKGKDALRILLNLLLFDMDQNPDFS